MGSELGLDPVVDDLAERYPRWPRSAIEHLVERHRATFADAVITTFVPILVRRAVEAELRSRRDGAVPAGSGDPGAGTPTRTTSSDRSTHPAMARTSA